MNSVTSDPRIFKIILLLVGIILVGAICLIWFIKHKERQKAEAPVPPPHPGKSEPSLSEGRSPGADSPDAPASVRTIGAPEFTTLQRRHWMLTDMVRVFLIILSLAAAGVLALILMPQPVFDKAVRQLQARHQVASPEQIGFLYLGDEIADSKMHIRGVVRNITAVPIEQLDAIIRFYSHDRILLETTIVRTSREKIGPGQLSQFELVYPDYRNEFASYSIEFKLRQGSLVPYKDMRNSRRGPINQ